MSWELISRSFAVLRRDRKLALFPVLTALAGLAVVALFLLSPVGDNLVWKPGPHVFGPADYAVLFLTYCALYFVMVFFNCALAACAQAHFAGRQLSLGGGIRKAAEHIQPILAWVLLSSTLGILLKAIEQRVGILGKIATRTFGFAWGMATYLVVPVLVIENRGPVDSIRQSGRLLRKTWGEQLTVGLVMGWMVLLVAVPGVVLGVFAAMFPPLIPVAVLYFLALIAATMAVRGIFDVALYQFATTGQAPAGYPPELLNRAFVPRR